MAQDERNSLVFFCIIVNHWFAGLWFAGLWVAGLWVAGLWVARLWAKGLPER